MVWILFISSLVVVTDKNVHKWQRGITLVRTMFVWGTLSVAACPNFWGLLRSLFGKAYDYIGRYGSTLFGRALAGVKWYLSFGTIPRTRKSHVFNYEKPCQPLRGA